MSRRKQKFRAPQCFRHYVLHLGFTEETCERLWRQWSHLDGYGRLLAVHDAAFVMFGRR
jgi:hypothetical protein